MRIFLALLVITLGWIMQGCTNEADRNAIRQMEQAATLMLSDPEVAHVLLADSVAHPELLSPEVNARWCLMLCQLADSIGMAEHLRYRFDWYAVALCAPNEAGILICETTRYNR